MAFGDFVQSQQLNTVGTSLAYPSNNTLGNLLIIGYRAESLNTTNSVTDTRGNTWLELGSPGDATVGHDLVVFYAYAASSGANTVTIHCSASVDDIIITEWEGPFSTEPLFDAAESNGFGTSVTTGVFSADRTSFFFVHGMSGGDDFVSGPPGWTDQIDDIPFLGRIISTVVTSAFGPGTVSLTGDTNMTDWWTVVGNFIGRELELEAASGSYVLSGSSAGLSTETNTPSFYLTNVIPVYSVTTQVSPI